MQIKGVVNGKIVGVNEFLDNYEGFRTDRDMVSQFTRLIRVIIRDSEALSVVADGNSINLMRGTRSVYTLKFYIHLDCMYLYDIV